MLPPGRLSVAQTVTPSCRQASLRLDVGGSDDLGPLLSFGGEEFAELNRCERQRGAAQIGKARLDFGIGDAPP